jgi:hypothetical protein
MKDAIRYKVTVIALVERVETVSPEWVVIGQEFKDGHPEKPVDVRGYTPEIKKTVRKEVAVFEQSVDALDMAALVKVVNGIAP